MRATKYLFLTLKEIPHHTESISHQLMLRSGMIRQCASGIYVWLPTGLRILNKIKKIIREELNKSGALEINMPTLQKENLWKKSGRLISYGQELFKIIDRRKNSFVLGPTHEEIITNFVKNNIKSYKELPILLYQIKTKFRDEIRPRFGIIRTREFIMKDAYSFHTNILCLKKTYKIIKDAYIKIFNKIKLNFYIVKADSGNMGGLKSHEFQALSQNGEDSIVVSTHSNYAANMQIASYLNQTVPTKIFSKIPFENTTELYISKNIYKKLTKKLKISKNNYLKTIIVKLKNNKHNFFVTILIASNYTLNIYKLLKLQNISYSLKLASSEEILKLTGTSSDFIGPIGINLPVIADFSIKNLKNFNMGSNITDKYFININWNKDILLPKMYDIRNVVEGDSSPDSKGTLKIKKSTEIAHIFQLGDKYSKSMNATIQDITGYKCFLNMGCYGIGVTRIIAIIIEQYNDSKGIIWPQSIAPFEVAIIPIKFNKSNLVKRESEIIYNLLMKHNIEVILDDRNQSIGNKLSEIELIGIPYSIIISDKNIESNQVEYRERNNSQPQIISKDKIIQLILSKINT